MKKLFSLSLASLVAVGLATTGVVYGQTHEGRVQAAHERKAQAKARSAEVRQQAQQRVEAIKEQVEERRAQIKQDVCERRQDQLQKVMPRLATSATTLQSTFDEVYNRVQTFYEDGQLTVENYDALKAEVDTARTASAAAVAAVEDYQFELNCDEPGVGTQLDGFRQSVKEARDAIMDYRTQLVELISALKAEAADSADQNGSAAQGNETADDAQNNDAIRSNKEEQ